MRQIVAALCVVVFGACQNNEASNLPVNPGGGGPGGGGLHLDGGRDSSDGARTTFKVCLLTDPRGLDACAPNGAANLTVTLGSGSNAPTATTADDGSFTIQVPSGNGLVWYVTSTGTTPIMPTMMPATGGSIIPAVTQDAYNTLYQANPPLSVDATAADVFMRVDINGNPVIGATASSSPAGTYPPLYDGASSQKWVDSTLANAATGTAGTVWFPALPGASSSADLTVLPSVDDTKQTFTVPIQAGWITMLFAAAT